MRGSSRRNREPQEFSNRLRCWHLSASLFLSTALGSSRRMRQKERGRKRATRSDGRGRARVTLIRGHFLLPHALVPLASLHIGFESCADHRATGLNQDGDCFKEQPVSVGTGPRRTRALVLSGKTARCVTPETHEPDLNRSFRSDQVISCRGSTETPCDCRPIRSPCG